MGALILSCQNLSKTVQGRTLFKSLSFGVFEGDRVGIVGPNGSGKSTLLRILAGLDVSDDGQVTRRRNLRIAYLEQSTVFARGTNAESILTEALEASGNKGAEVAIKRTKLLSQLDLEGAAQLPTERLSGGMAKRLALGEALARDPDLLFLDEPTNHLDLETILWLEEFLRTTPLPWVMISHDRYVLERTTTRMAELNAVYPEGVFLVDGRYSDFLERRATFLSGQQSLSESLANKARREVEWLRQGVKARGTKAKFRIDEAQALIQEVASVKNRIKTGAKGAPRIDFTASERKTKRLVVAAGVTKSLGERTIIKDFDLVLAPGMTVGLMGRNGVGKSTVLRLLAGELSPDTGIITHADGLKVVYFDQHRAQLDPASTLRKTLAPFGDSVLFRGQSVHVASWARRFHFSAEQLNLTIANLSGGERARAMIARLMLSEADVLLLDEPTNDLDIPTLEALEENIEDFQGACILVSHDRHLIDGVCNVLIGLDLDGAWGLFADYAQWEARTLRSASRAFSTPKATLAVKAAENRASEVAPKAKRLSYMEQREYDQMEGAILEAETHATACRALTEEPATLSSSTLLTKAYNELRLAEDKVCALYERWTVLEGKIKG